MRPSSGAFPYCERGRGTTVRFIHAADLQLGMTRHFLDADARATYAQARIDALRAIGRMASAEAADFVIVAGDVFETNRVGPRTVRRALEAIADITVPVFLLPGNHDPLDAASVYRSSTFERGKPANVTVLDRPDAVEVRPGVEVVGAPWLSKRPLGDLVTAACATLTPTSSVTRILVGHGAVDELIDFGNPAVIRLADVESAVTDGRVHYVALGDRHSTTQVGSTGRVWYAGTPEPTDYDETDAGNVLVVDVDETACTVTRRPIGTWRFVDQRFELDEEAAIDAVASWIDGQAAKDRTIVRLSVVGTVSLSQHARLQAMIDDARDVFAAIEDWEQSSDLVVRPDDDDFADLALTGFAKTAVERLRAAVAAGGAEGRTARDALALLVRLAHDEGATAR